MEIIFFLNFLVSMLLALIVLINFTKYHGKKNIGKIAGIFLIMSFSYLILTILFFLWSFGFLNSSQMDFLLIYSIVIFVQTLVIFKVFYISFRNKTLLYFLLFYIFSFFSFVYSYSYFFNFFLITSFLLTAVVSMNLMLKNSNLRKGILWLIYSFASLFSQFLILLLKLDSNIFYLGSSLILSGFLFVFLKEFNDNCSEDRCFRVSEEIKSKRSYLMTFIRSFLFIIIIAIIVFIGTVGTHELGHFGLSKIYSCENSKIIYEGSSPYTEALCKSPSIQKILLLGGLLPFFIAAFLFIFGGKLMKHISLLITGFNIVILYQDLVELGLSSNIILFLVSSGIIILVIGIMSLAKSSTEEYVNII